MTTTALSWPREAQPRNDSSWWACAWLLGRHPMLAALLERTGLVKLDPRDPEVPDAEFVQLADAFLELDERSRAWREATRYSDPPQDDEAYERWCRSHGIKELSPVAEAIAPMSGGEQRRLRLLATLTGERVAWHTGDLYGLDDSGAALVDDWLRLIRWHVTGTWS